MRKIIAVSVLLTTVVAVAEDSPLVALAKRTNRKASKTPVITDEKVAKSNGRVSIATGDAKQPSRPTPARAATPASAPTTPQQTTRQATAAAPASTNVPHPSSTARNIEPQSTIRAIEPSASVSAIAPQSTAGTIQPQSTVQNVAPQATNQPPE